MGTFGEPAYSFRYRFLPVPNPTRLVTQSPTRGHRIARVASTGDLGVGSANVAKVGTLDEPVYAFRYWLLPGSKPNPVERDTRLSRGRKGHRINDLDLRPIAAMVDWKLVRAMQMATEAVPSSDLMRPHSADLLRPS